MLIALAAFGIASYKCHEPPAAEAGRPIAEVTPAQSPALEHSGLAVPSAAWDKVWTRLQSPADQQPALPEASGRERDPERIGDSMVFRFRAPAGTRRVFLAGDFNSWAHNTSGKVTDPRFAMNQGAAGIWFKRIALQPAIYQYQYVIENAAGGYQWVADPNVAARDAAGHSLLEVSAIAASFGSGPQVAVPAGRHQTAVVPPNLEVQVKEVWVRPDQRNSFTLALDDADTRGGTVIQIEIKTPLGQVVHRAAQPAIHGENHLVIPALEREGGYLLKVEVVRGDRVFQWGGAVLSVVGNVADDLRYGFYSNYGKFDGDYDAKAAMLARLHINAVEYYDYFPAHGSYAPREAEYRFEPFGTRINGRDIKAKMDAGRRRNILSLAYVSAYAASASVYQKHPFPMTDALGAPKVFNGEIMTEAQADQMHKPKWFWLTNIAGDSPWHQYIMENLARALDDTPEDLLSFDGFEIDTYGDAAETRFYAKGSSRNGDLLVNVLHDFVGDIHALTRKSKPNGLVAVNNVNEFSGERMHDVTDFLFLEIWRSHAEQLEDLVDICCRHREQLRQRVVLKLYPADMDPKQVAWPPATLARILGATMTGGGSLMVVGEPDERNSVMHGLNSLYYPDHHPLRSGNDELLRAYHEHDALMLGYTHGRNVYNIRRDVMVADCITRVYAAPQKQSLVVQLLHAGTNRSWSEEGPYPSPKINFPIAMDLPGGVAPREVFFASPDVRGLQQPVKLDFDVTMGCLRTSLPELRVHGTLVLQY